MNLLKNSKYTVMTRGDTGLAATNVDSSVLVDMSGWDGIQFIASIVEVTAGASTTAVSLLPRHATSNNATSLTDLGSTAAAGDATVSTGDVQKALIVDVYRPLQRYMSVSVDKAGAGTSQIGPVIAVQYKGKKTPVTQSTTYVYSSKQAVSPTT
jgi:hypothetical protein